MIEKAKWITCGEHQDAPVISRKLTVRHPQKAVIEITGLGWFELYLNGRRVSEDYFMPVLSDYTARDMSAWTYPMHDETTHRVYYLTYDLLPYLIDGENLLEIRLGNGWYHQEDRIAEGDLSFGYELPARYALALTDADGTQTVCSDGTETWKPSEILFNNLFYGERHDARLLHDPAPSRPVRLFPDFTDSVFSPQNCPSDRIIRTITPHKRGESDGRTVFDAGENISGWVRVRTKGKSGEEIRLRFAEELDTDGNLDFRSAGSGYYSKLSGAPQIQSDTFICDGQERIFVPRFVFHAFRFFDITGPFEDLQIEVVHSDIPRTSSFSSNHEGLNWLYDAYLRTELDNMHTGIPSDCPHRERLGYTGDGQITAEAAMLLLDSRAFYRKWIQDILDCQDIHSGHVQHTAPMMGGGGGPGGWGCAIVIVPYRFYRVFGEISVLEQTYPAMQKWIRYLRTRMENGLIVREEDGGWCLGDWAMPGECRIPEPFVNTCYYILSLKMMAEIAGILGKPDDIAAWDALRLTAEHAVRTAYYDEQTGSFCGGEQAADAYAVMLGLGDERTMENLINRYETLNYLDTGFLGTDFLFDALFSFGGENIALRLLSNDHPGSYLWMKRQGATTIWEHLNGGSHNHPMFGAPARFLFTRILGITQEADSAGYRKLLLKPCFPNGLHQVSGQLALPCGAVQVSWHNQDGTITYEATLPDGVPARLEADGRSFEAHSGYNVWKWNKTV